MQATALGGALGSPSSRHASDVDGGRADVGRNHWLSWLAFVILAIPTFIRMATLSWSTEGGAHGPIVLVTGAWLFYRSRGQLGPARPFALPAFGILLPILGMWMFGRITSLLAVESLALYGVGLTLLVAHHGVGALRRFWFPLFYFLFLITPPENWMVVGTQPLKLAISSLAVDITSAFGMVVGRTGVIIQVDGYQLLVATACSGVNSLFGICAITSLYVYLMHGSEPRYAAILVSALLPVAILANLIRVVLLILITHFFGESVMEGIIHTITGMGMFILSLGILLLLDQALHPIVRRMGWAA